MTTPEPTEPPPETPTEDVVRGWFDSLSNWGRWGPDDSLGTLNLIDDAVRLRALQLATTGRMVSCGRPLERGGGTTQPTVRFVTRSGTEAPAVGMGYADDWWGVGIHGFDVTHLDAPSHLFWNGQMYNGRAAGMVTSTGGAEFGSIDAVPGIVTRGVFLDIPAHRGVAWVEQGDAIGPDELDACAAAAGITIDRGDALILRTGRDAAVQAGAFGDPMDAGVPGLHATCVPWLHAHDVAMIMCDAISDVSPTSVPGITLPVHAIGIVAMGLWLLDNAWLEDLAAACAQEQRIECALVVSPLQLAGGTGSPVNPLALF